VNFHSPFPPFWLSPLPFVFFRQPSPNFLETRELSKPKNRVATDINLNRPIPVKTMNRINDSIYKSRVMEVRNRERTWLYVFFSYHPPFPPYPLLSLLSLLSHSSFPLPFFISQFIPITLSPCITPRASLMFITY
jgi:hypothetical protein